LVRVFLYQGIIIGLFGGLLGLSLGYLVVKNRQVLLDVLASWGFDPFPSEFNGFDGLPAIIDPSEFGIVFVFAVTLCILATLIPALLATRSDAAKSLRNM
jgi:lipoprotein-releasing system permease protein